VVSSFPLGEIIQSREETGRIAKWSVELMSETLTYAPRKSIKSQALVDFIAEWTDSQLPPTQVQSELWTMYFDGSLMNTGAGAGLLLISPLGVVDGIYTMFSTIITVNIRLILGENNQTK